MTEPYSPTARANASANPVRIAGCKSGQKHPGNRLEAIGAKRCRSLLYLLANFFHHRLDCPDHERETDEYQGDGYADGRKGDFNAKRIQQMADPAISGVKRRQGDTCDCRRQGKW